MTHALFHAPARGLGEDNDDDDDTREPPGRVPARPLVSLNEGEREETASDAAADDDADKKPDVFLIDAPLSLRAPLSCLPHSLARWVWSEPSSDFHESRGEESVRKHGLNELCFFVETMIAKENRKNSKNSALNLFSSSSSSSH